MATVMDDEDEEDEFENITFEGYRVVGLLGRGAGGGAVYEVWSATGGARAAAKWPARREEREALQALKGCLGVPRLFGEGSLDGQAYVITEVLGKPLKQAFAELRSWPILKRWQAVCVVGRLLLRRLLAIHEHGYIHCDLQPGNVLLGNSSSAPERYKRPYLIDYGSARKFPGGGEMHGDWGSVDFNSIASADGGERGPQDDVESLGWMLLHFLLGDLPWFQLTRETDWKDRSMRKETVREVRAMKVKALEEGWSALDGKWRKFTQMPKAMHDFLHSARGTGDHRGPDYAHLGSLLGVREGQRATDAEEEDLLLLPLALEEARLCKVLEEDKMEMEASGSKVVWEVVGGSDVGGIVVREGKDVHSAQRPDRLARGSLVEEERLEGSRMLYRRLLGAGPDTGWVSVRLKGHDLMARLGTKRSLLDPEERRKHRAPVAPKEKVEWWSDWDEILQEFSANSKEPPPSVGVAREPSIDSRTDIVVVGATGITGMLACDLLRQRLVPGRTWTIAGRDARKLSLLERKFGAHTPGFRGACCMSSPEQIENLARGARVVVDFSGPKFRVGMDVAAACVRMGTHYVDTSVYAGDVLFSRQVREKLHGEACQSKVSLVYYCTASSVQVDFGIWRVVRHLREHYGVSTRRVDVYQRQKHALGGTPLLSFLGWDNHPSEVARCMPFVLGGQRPGGPREEDMDEMAVMQDEASGLWLSPGGRNAEVMIGRCSCGMFDATAPYGRRFLLKEWEVSRNKQEADASFGMAPFLRKGYSKLLIQEQVPPPHHGPPQSVRQAASFVLLFTAKADEVGNIKPNRGRRKVHSLLHAGPMRVGDPGEGTAVVALEACACLLDAADGRGAGAAGPGALRPGFGTPTWHLSHLNFLERLVAQGYWHFSDVESGPPSSLLLKQVANWGQKGQGPTSNMGVRLLSSDLLGQV